MEAEVTSCLPPLPAGSSVYKHLGQTFHGKEQTLLILGEHRGLSLLPVVFGSLADPTGAISPLPEPAHKVQQL